VWPRNPNVFHVGVEDRVGLLCFHLRADFDPPGGFAVRLRMRLDYRAKSFISPAFNVTCSMAKKGERQPRPEQAEEAQKIYEWLLFQRRLASNLISASVKLIGDKKEAADARTDLETIVRHLARSVTGEWDATWQSYQKHFIGDQNRHVFFTKLRKCTRLIASIALVRGWQTEDEGRLGANADFQWDTSLLPESIARSVLRLAILHPGVLEDFLPRFFTQSSDCLLQGSTYRRAVSILQAVSWSGWSAEKHTKRLIELREIKPSEVGSEVETVKKFIRDLRRRYQKYVQKKGQGTA
jgi:hypothetical protein